jgi:hypothetical protein
MDNKRVLKWGVDTRSCLQGKTERRTGVYFDVHEGHWGKSQISPKPH